jgi:hypothetical protein
MTDATSTAYPTNMTNLTDLQLRQTITQLSNAANNPTNQFQHYVSPAPQQSTSKGLLPLLTRSYSFNSLQLISKMSTPGQPPMRTKPLVAARVIALQKLSPHQPPNRRPPRT